MKKKIKLISLLLVIVVGVFLKNEISASNSISYVLIEEAVKEGRISSEQGLLYKVWRRFAPDKLPGEFRSGIAEPCGTRLWLELQENWPRLSSQTKNEIRKYIKVQEHSEIVTSKTPIPPLERTYSYGNFVIKYTISGIHGVNPADADLDGVPDYIETVALCFQNYSWTIIADLGYSMPSTPYTVNVFELRKTYGINGEMQSIDLGKTTPQSKTVRISKSYINIDNDLDLVKTYTDAHELFHAVQICNGVNHNHDYTELKRRRETVELARHTGRRAEEASFTGMFNGVPLELKIFLFAITMIFVLINSGRKKVDE